MRRTRASTRYPTAQGSWIVSIAFSVVFTSCTTGGQSGSASQRPPQPQPSSVESPILWSADLGQPSSAPTVVGDVVYVAAGESLFALPADCSDPCQQKWMGHLPVGRAATGWDTDYTGTADGYHAPVVASGHVYVATEHPAGVAAFPATCRHATCPAQWFGRVAQAASDPVVANGAVFVGSGAGRIYAFSASCTATCAPRSVVVLPGTYKHPGGSPPIALAGGMVVISSSDRLYAVNARTRQLAWWGGPGAGGASGGGSSSTVYADGAVYATLWGTDPNVPRLYGFKVNCRQDGGECAPVWSAGTDDDFLGGPSFDGQMIYAGTETTQASGDGTLYGYSSACASSKRCSSWSTHVPSELVVGWFATHDGTLYAVSREQGDAYAYRLPCNDGCSPVWRTATLSTRTFGTDDITSTGPYAPVFVGDKVVFATTGGAIRIFDPATCPSDGSTCETVGSWEAHIGHLTNIATDKSVAFVGSNSGTVIAFRP
jgi:outer membrane protein assembly factor BamB